MCPLCLATVGIYAAVTVSTGSATAAAVKQVLKPKKEGAKKT
jgi:hypothetical protein